ncbi:hypothetical protein [Aliikangiella sp. IMCC44359]|uniref:hypothetical protein n=1 Tax=Aliikangiella sp. IMCC44359 TaxID=3459125 RepID=UPI00403B152B
MSSKSIRRRVWVPIVFFVWIMILGKPSPLYYEIEPVSAQVVDAETGEPISGATIALGWGMIKSTYHSNSSSAGSLGGGYTRTNQEGYFTFPGWKRWWREWFSFSDRRIDAASPAFRAIKSGYVPITIYVPSLLMEKSAPPKKEDKSKKARLQIKQVVKGLKDEIIRIKKLPQEPQARYDAFHNVFTFWILESQCYDAEYLKSGHLEEIFKEQKIALQAGLNLELSDEERQTIIDFKEPHLAACLQVTNGLIRQRL